MRANECRSKGRSQLVAGCQRPRWTLSAALSCPLWGLAGQTPLSVINIYNNSKKPFYLFFLTACIPVKSKENHNFNPIVLLDLTKSQFSTLKPGAPSQTDAELQHAQVRASCIPPPTKTSRITQLSRPRRRKTGDFAQLRQSTLKATGAERQWCRLSFKTAQQLSRTVSGAREFVIPSVIQSRAHGPWLTGQSGSCSGWPRSSPRAPAARWAVRPSAAAGRTPFSATGRLRWPPGRRESPPRDCE